MADKNFARSGTVGSDFLADDDPLSELARLVGYEPPRPVQPVTAPLVEPVRPAERHANPVLALEDELMRAFEQYDAPRRAAAAPPRREEPVFEAFDAPEADDDAGLLLADEIESAVEEVPAVEAEHPGRAFADRFEPRFEAPEPLAESPAFAPAGEPVFLGLQPLAEPAPDIGLDLERELELSLGEDFSVAPDEPAFDVAWPAEPPADAEPFVAAEPAYAEAEPQFFAELPREAPEERARVLAEAEAQWQAEPVFAPEPAYEVETVARGDAYDHDELLAEVERYPVPETRSPLAEIMTRATPVFGRATPVASFEPVREVAPEPVAAPVVAKAPEPAAVEPEIDFDNFELDLSDIDFDLDPAELTVEAETPHAVAVPVSAYTAPPPAAPDFADGALPFDPAMIADTDEGVAPVTELDVPQLPVIEKEKPPVQHGDYDFDIDAEMAQLFTAPQDKPAAEDMVAVARPAARIAEVDDFERALEEDFRRSLAEPERMAIPVDPGRADGLSAGDGYGEASPPARRGLLIAASLAGLLLVGGGLYAWTSLGDGGTGSGEPLVILADKAPVKVVPEEKGGKTVPNQDKAVYDRVAGNTDASPQQDQLVTTTEEPVDVVQRTLTPETLPFDGPAEDDGPVAEDEENRLLPGVDEPATADAEEGRTPLVSPRKVRTMIVKPDGTLVAREDTVAEPEPERVSAEATATTAGAVAEAVATVDEAAALPAEADAPLRTGEPAAEPSSALAEVANVEVEDTAPVRVVKTTTLAAEEGKAPVPATRPADQPVNVVGTVTEKGNVSATAPAAEAAPAPAETQVAAVAPGSYVIQIASLPSEAEAQRSYDTLSAKFSSVIGGRGVDIRKAEIAGKGTYYRVRIPAGSRDEANALCARYKSAGGSCLVTR